MRDDRAAKRLQETVVIPETVQQRADLVFAQIKKECASAKDSNAKNRDTKRIENGGKQMGYTRKTAKRGMWAAIAAAVLALGTVVCAAYMHWSHGMEQELNATPEQKEYLEEGQITTPLNSSVTEEGITVTLQQSIVDARFAHLSFRVDGYQAAEGIQPGFEYTSMTLEGDSLNMTGGGFFDNLHADGNGNFTYTDGTPAKETADGSIIGKYINDDGSMEYIMTVMTTDKDKSLIGKPIHIELQNLGTLGKTAFTPDIHATWTFDFTLAASGQTRSIELSQPLGDSGAVVKKAELSPISLYVEYDFPLQKTGLEGVDENGNPVSTTTFAEPPRLTGVRLKDGTRLTSIINGGSEGYTGEDQDTYIAYFATDHILDLEQVDALLFIQSEAMTAEEAKNIPEEKLYIVSF